MPKLSATALWVLLTVQLLAAAYCALGLAMTSSFTVSNPGHGHERAAAIYLILMLAALLGSLACLVTLIRRRPRSYP